MINEVVLDAFRFGVSSRMKRMGVERDIKIYAQTLGEQTFFNLETYIYGIKHEEKEISYHADWWEAFKERFAPSWFLEKYPVKLKIIKVNLKELYPDFKYSIPRQRVFTKITSRDYASY